MGEILGVPNIQLLFIFWASLFVIAFIIQIIFPVEVYENLSTNNTIVKGKFAYTVESIYNIKKEGLDADGKYWGHILLFNGLASLGVSTAIVYLLLAIIMILIAIVFIIGVIIAIRMWLS